MRCKLFDDPVLDLGDGYIGLIKPIAEMSGAMPQMVKAALPISTGDEMIEIRLKQRPQHARVESPSLLRHYKR
jgi:hypothetical protein